MASSVARPGPDLFAGLAAWAVVGLPAVLSLSSGDAAADAGRLGLALVAWAAFGALFLPVAAWWVAHWSDRAHHVLLTAETALAMAVTALLPEYGTSAILFILTAVHGAHVLGRAVAPVWLLAQGAWVAVVAAANGADATELVLQGLGFTSFMAFAYVVTRTGQQEAASRRLLAERNAELRATRQLLAEHQRVAERVRISRELHDLVGHHLTALILNLGAARRADGEAGGEALGRAEALARSLLDDVREAVRTLRDDDAVDVAQALRTLVRDLPTPPVHATLPPSLRLTDPRAAHTLVRAAQELCTNALRHAGASHVSLSVARRGDRIHLDVDDDGRGADLDGRDAGVGTEGSGLEGLRERLRPRGGDLEIRTAPGRGFTARVSLPDTPVVEAPPLATGPVEELGA